MAERLNFFEKNLIKTGAAFKGRGLTPRGKKVYQSFIDGIAEGKPQALSQQIGILDGYEKICTGKNCLEDLTGGALLASNYPNFGPMGESWHPILTSFIVEEQSGKEPRWLISYGKFWPVNIIHACLAESIEGIIVNDPHNKLRGTREIRSALLGGAVVGMYPEGHPAKKVGPVKKSAAGIIHWAVENNIPIITVSTWPEGRKLITHFQLHNPDEVLEQAKQTVSLENIHNGVGDHIMRAITGYLPDDLKGAWQGLGS